MTEEEKFSVRSNLDFYIGLNESKLTIKSPWYSSMEFIFTRTFATAFSVILVFALGVGTFSSVQRSLPGEALYPLKVNVVEPLEYTMAVGQVSKANLEIKNIDSRLREAELLEVQGRLSDSISSDLENKINAHSENFNSIISNLTTENKVDDNSDVNIDFEANINAHSRIIDSIGTSTKEEGNINKIRQSIQRNSGKNMTKSSDTAVATMSAAPAAFSSIQSPENLIRSSTTTVDADFVEKKIDTERIIKLTRENIERVKKGKNINRKILQEAENTITDAESSLKSAEMESKSGDKTKAFSNLINSRRRAKEANTTFEVSQDLKDRSQD